MFFFYYYLFNILQEAMSEKSQQISQEFRLNCKRTYLYVIFFKLRERRNR